MFKIGDRVKVINNTERDSKYSLIGFDGTVVGVKSNDFLVEFESCSHPVAIIERDLVLFNGK